MGLASLRSLPAALKRRALGKPKEHSSARKAGDDGDDDGATKLFSIHAVACKGALRRGQTWRAGNLFMRGAKEGSAFYPQEVSLKSEYITYNPSEDAMTDVIYFHEIVGVLHCGMEEAQFPRNFRSPEIYPNENARAREVTQMLEVTDFAIVTTDDGYYKGQVHVFRASTRHEMELWTASIARVLHDHMDSPKVDLGRVHGLRRRIRRMYVGSFTQTFLALLIVANFFINIVEYQATTSPAVVEITAFCGVVFTILFTIELVVNAGGTLFVFNAPEKMFWEFTSSLWNWFDTLVVVISLVGLILPDVPEVTIMRLLRVFRVIRLFRRIPSLRRLMKALGNSMMPMLNAFAIVVLVTCICAIMGVSFFREPGPYTKAEFGYLFSDFFTSIFTMFQVMTGDDWGNICRQLMKDSAEATNGGGWSVGVAVFFVVYQLVVGMVLLNVVIAVLLDEFGKAAASEKQEKAKRSEMSVDGDVQAIRCPFESIFSELSLFKDLQDLEHHIEQLFNKMIRQADAHFEGTEKGKDGRMSFAYLAWAMRNMDGAVPVCFDEMDWEHYVVAPGIARRDGTLGLSEFSAVIRQALRRHQLRAVTIAMCSSEEIGWNQKRVQQTLQTVKMIVMEEAAFQRGLDAGLAGVSVDALGDEPHDPELCGSEGEGKVEALVTEFADSLTRLQERFAEIETRLTGCAREIPAHDDADAAPSACVDGEPAEEAPRPGPFAFAESFRASFKTPQMGWPFGEQAGEGRGPAGGGEGRGRDRKHASAPNPQGRGEDVGALVSARSRPPTARDLHREGWAFMRPGGDPLARIPGVSQVAGLGQGVSNGILGGFASLGNVFGGVLGGARASEPLYSSRGRQGLPAPTPRSAQRARGDGIEISASPGRANPRARRNV